MTVCAPLEGADSSEEEVSGGKALKDLLPVGSVVRLKNAVRKAVIMGYMQQVNPKDSPGQKPEVYDYMAVPYPEGYLGKVPLPSNCRTIWSWSFSKSMSSV